MDLSSKVSITTHSDDTFYISTQDTHTNSIWYHLSVESKKKSIQMDLTYKTEIDLQTYETNLWLPNGKKGEGDIRSSGL